MNLNDYQKLAMSTAVYPKLYGLQYVILGLVGEAGEIANKRKKELRSGVSRDEEIKEELGDVLWYAAAICNEYGWSLEDVARENIEKLQKRREEHTLKER